MTHPVATLTDCMTALAKADPETPVVFRTDTDRINGGYHLTELRHSRIDGIDCGGRTASWDEAQLELLDGGGGDHMTVGKLTKILRASLTALPALARAPLSIAFAPGNVGLHRYAIADVTRQDGEALVTLAPARAICKPWAATPNQETGCCSAA